MLTSGTSHERLKAARLLARGAGPGDLPTLRQALQAETVSYVKTSLDLAIRRLSKLTVSLEPDPVDEHEIPEAIKQQIRTEAVEQVTGLVLHEISSPIGRARFAASREIPEFQNSETKRHLDRVQSIFHSIEQLKKATITPKPESFDLAEFILHVAHEEATPELLDNIALTGPKPMIILSDPNLIQLTVSNGIRNALETIASTDISETFPVIVGWGETDVDYWVTILDRGAGIVGPVDAAFEIGKSTKDGHSGFGLAIARQAMERLGGSVRLEPRADGGARFEARWAR